MAAKISISLTDAHARLLNEAVASGDYASSSEVIREALREWRGMSRRCRLFRTRRARPDLIDWPEVC